ncbi:phage tail protein [Agromyces soli]
MTIPYVGEIRTVGFNFAPQGWALCEGQLMPISQNTALFSLLGTSYGGDGKSTFALPDLRGAFAIGQGDGEGLSPRWIGEQGGASAVTLITSEMPAHIHAANAVAAPGSTGSPVGAVWAEPRYGRSARPAYSADPAGVELRADALSVGGGDLPHNNMPPYLGMYFIIALQGVFPPRS